jgi:hypothetical protein
MWALGNAGVDLRSRRGRRWWTIRSRPTRVASQLLRADTTKRDSLARADSIAKADTTKKDAGLQAGGDGASP